MKGRLPSIFMVFVALAMVLSAVAVVAPDAKTANAETGGLNAWQRHDLPTTLHWQMAPNTNIWDLTAADDGTLFALVEDTSGAVDIMEDAAAAPAAAPCTWDGRRWAVFPAWSDVALFKSTDGGVTWELMWHVPASDSGAPVAVVPQPGYVDGDSTNGVIFVATGTRYKSTGSVGPGGGALPGTIVGGPAEGNLYRSMDGGAMFTRVTPRVPSVTLTTPGTITCMDVAENIMTPGTYMAIVGTSSLRTSGGGVAGRGEGVWTWNEDNDRDWKDQMVANALPPAPFPGSMPAGNGLDVLAVLASPTYTEDGTFMAVVSDILPADPAGSALGIYVCYWDNFDGVWGGDVDSPTTALITSAPPAADGDYAWAACMAVGEDFQQVVANFVFVGLDGCGIAGAPPAANNNDVWRIQGLSTVTGPSRATRTNLIAVANVVPDTSRRIADIVVVGPAASGAVYVGVETPASTSGAIGTIPMDGQAQVFKAIQAVLWPAWTPSFKPPSGAWPTLLADMSGTLMAAGGGDGYACGGVHKLIDGFGGRMVFNGMGLLDDIAVSEDIPGYVNPVGDPSTSSLSDGTSWCLAEATAEDVSPTYETDRLMYVSTYSTWNHDDGTGPGEVRPYQEGMSLWRWTDGTHWERVLKEYLTLLTTALANPAATAFDQYRSMPIRTNHGRNQFVNQGDKTAPFIGGIAGILGDGATWWPRVPRGFSADPYVFLLGGVGDNAPGGAVQPWDQDLLWYSPDLGDSWVSFAQMPIGALNLVVTPRMNGLSESGWWVEDNNTVLCGDMGGWIYRTTDRGASWTEGALTAAGLEITTIITSPIYANDSTLLAGTLDETDQEMEVWLSQDSAMQDLENVCAEINTDPAWDGWAPGPAPTRVLGETMVNFDINWADNHVIYAGAGGWLDRWQLVGTGSTQLTRIDSTDVGIYRTEVTLTDPSASTWEQIWDADDFNAIAKAPQPLPNMMAPPIAWDIYRWVSVSGLRIGNDGTIYVPIAIWDLSYNPLIPGFAVPKPPSPNPNVMAPSGFGRFTAGGALRCLDGTQATPEWNFIDQGLGEWDGLYMNRAIAGGSNTLISLAYDWQEWRYKLAIYDDTLSTTGAATAPTAGSTGVGTLANNQVSVTLDWADLDATVYQWQVDDDCGFVTPLVASGVTSESLVTVTGLEPGVKYCWRARANEPTLSRWSDAQSFNTVIGSELLAPQLLAPAAGETILSKKPTFQWSAIGWGDKYDIQVATDAGFAAASLVINQNLGNVQAYQAPSDLANGTYYWHVKAKSDTSQTAWSSTGTFTIAKNLPGQAQTAGWVWALIVIGIVLVVLMLMLIMRTRRPV